MTAIERLTTTQIPFLTDGGFETSLFFLDGFEAPEFAALVLMDDAEARAAMRRYFERFLAMAEAAGAGYVLDTNTWRACPQWAPKLGKSKEDMARLTRDAVTFAKEIRAAWSDRVSPILLNGVVGPAGDGYTAGETPSAEEARVLHGPQLHLFAEEGVDMVTALTMTNVGEATGIVQLAEDLGLPCVISFTVETDGRLPTGEALGEAIEAVDAATGGAPLYFMVNCAHPDHFHDALAAKADWVERIGGVRANASRLSHAELDVAETLDDGDPQEFGALHAELARILPNLRVVGGCCGTDHRHVGCISHHLHRQAA
jgi:homocysteine S-methyltransferase